jgi:non-canonical poly(A) RNA polymerase PAPD5/7
MLQVKSAFSKAYSVLTDANLISSLRPNRSILGTIVRPDSVLLDRKGSNTEDMIRDMLMVPWEPVTQQFDSENDEVYNWHAIDYEPLPRNSQFTSDDTSSSPLQKRSPNQIEKQERRRGMMHQAVLMLKTGSERNMTDLLIHSRSTHTLVSGNLGY